MYKIYIYPGQINMSTLTFIVILILKLFKQLVIIENDEQVLKNESYMYMCNVIYYYLCQSLMYLYNKW